MKDHVSRQLQLKRRPQGKPMADDFELIGVALGEPSPGEVLVRNQWMSVDPYILLGMADDNDFVPDFPLHSPIAGFAVGEVLRSRDPGFAEGDLVFSRLGWREAFIAPAAALRKCERLANVPDHAYLSVLGTTGRTAYGGFVHLGRPSAGETVFISGAAGAVGSMVCQIAKIIGCTVIASVGSDEKAAWLRSLGADQVVNYRQVTDLGQAVAEAAPNGIDIYFDNVGGEHLEVAFDLAVPNARFIECGMISTYAGASQAPRNMMLMVTKSITLFGFGVTGLFNRIPDLEERFGADVGRWVAEGRLDWRETVMNGIDQAGEALIRLFEGDCIGKMLVKL